MFYDGQKFQRQCVNVTETTWGRIYFLTCEISVQFCIFLSVARILIGKDDEYEKIKNTHSVQGP